MAGEKVQRSSGSAPPAPACPDTSQAMLVRSLAGQPLQSSAASTPPGRHSSTLPPPCSCTSCRRTCAARPLPCSIPLLEQLPRLPLSRQLQRPLVQLRLEGQVGVAQALRVKGRVLNTQTMRENARAKHAPERRRAMHTYSYSYFAAHRHTSLFSSATPCSRTCCMRACASLALRRFCSSPRRRCSGVYSRCRCRSGWVTSCGRGTGAAGGKHGRGVHQQEG